MDEKKGTALFLSEWSVVNAPHNRDNKQISNQLRLFGVTKLKVAKTATPYHFYRYFYES